MIVHRLQDEAPHLVPAMIVGRPTSARQLATALKVHPQVVVSCTARTIVEAIDHMAQHQPRVVFLDVAVTDRGKLAAARQLAAGRALVIVSDRPDDAFEAFECGAIDYLLKPVTVDRMRATFQRLEHVLAPLSDRPGEAGEAESSPRLTISDRVSIPSRPSASGRTTDLVPVCDVIWIESLQNYTIVQLPGADRRTIKRTLTEWEALLPAPEFVRLGRSHLVQLKKLKTITSPGRDACLAHFHDVERPLQLGRAPASKLKRIVRESCSA